MKKMVLIIGLMGLVGNVFGSSTILVEDNITPLIGALQRNTTPQREVLKLVPAYAGFGDDVDSDGNTAMHLAVQRGYLKVVKALIAQGAFYNSRNRDGKRALGLALRKHNLPRRHNLEIIEALVATQGEDLKKPNKILSSDGDTQLMEATKAGRIDLVKVLMAVGADVTLKNNQGQTAFDIATNKGHDSIAELLNPDTAVMKAVKGGKRDVVRALSVEEEIPALEGPFLREISTPSKSWLETFKQKEVAIPAATLAALAAAGGAYGAYKKWFK